MKQKVSFSFLFLLSFFLLNQAAFAAKVVPFGYSVGFTIIGANVPGSNEPQEIAVWYPLAIKRSGTVELDGYTFAATNNARIAETKFPLLMLSHDMASTNTAQHAIAIELAQKGFIVAAPTHAGDNSRNSELLFLPKQILYRPLHISHALDLVLADAFFAEHIQKDAIGLIGVGAGASTALMLAGATPLAFDSYAYCLAAPYDGTYCNSWSKNRLQLFGKNAMIPVIPKSADQEVTRIIDQTLLQAQILAEEHITLPPLYFTGGDKRFSSIALLVPGYAQLFPRESVLFLEIPVYVASAGKDVYYFPHLQAEPLVKALQAAPANNVVQHTQFENADHWAFFGFCDAGTENYLQEMCTNLSQAEFTALTQVVSTELAAFFIQQTFVPALTAQIQAEADKAAPWEEGIINEGNMPEASISSNNLSAPYF